MFIKTSYIMHTQRQIRCVVFCKKLSSFLKKRKKESICMYNLDILGGNLGLVCMNSFLFPGSIRLRYLHEISVLHTIQGKALKEDAFAPNFNQLTAQTYL